MKKGISLHLGLNYVDPKHYDGWNGELFACEADADDMTALAKSRGFKPQKLLRENVTAKAVKAAILKAAKTLKSGDTFFLTYSGHGGQVPDGNGDEGRFGDENDGKDETWCLFDREFVDDELAALYAKFKAGVRILVLSDSCHSGSVTRARDERKPAGRVRLLPPQKAAQVYEKNKGLYDAIQRGVTGAEEQEIKATVLLISGCQDRQLSNDGDLNGLFTGTLKRVWYSGVFRGGYKHFRDQIAAQMPTHQIPNYFVVGAENKAFENEDPFTIDVTAIKRGGTKAKAPAKRSAAAPIDFVLRELEIMGLNKPTAATIVKKFFAECERIDGDLGLDFTRTDAFVERFLEAFDGVALGKSDLIKGRYNTAQDIADLAG